MTLIFNISIKTNYKKQIVFKNLQCLLTQLVSFIAIMESQSYRTFIVKSMGLSVMISQSSL